ncbi:MAG: FliM/FliN family flagellar motor switch protein [Myxococcota bacterium]
MAPRPYPYESWPKVSRPSLPAIRRAARWLAGRGEAVRSAAAKVLDQPIHVGPVTLHLCDEDARRGALRTPLAAVVLGGGAAGAERAVLELSPPLAAAMADRLLGGEGEARPGALSAGECGALAYLAARVLAEVAAPFAVETVATTTAQALSALGNASAHVVASAPLSVAGASGVVRAWIADRPDLFPARFVNLQTPIPFSVDMAACRLRARELRDAREQDVIVLEDDEVFTAWRVRARGSRRRTWWVDRSGRITRIEELELTGAPIAPSAKVEKKPEGETALQEESKERTAQAGYEEATAKAAIDAVGDVPVDLRLEIARFSLPLEAVGALAEGEVLVSDVNVGDAVRLVVGDRDYATGELVDVDGHVGVRILRRLVP